MKKNFANVVLFLTALFTLNISQSDIIQAATGAYETVNVITLTDEKVTLPSTVVTYSDNQGIDHKEVVWSKINDAIFKEIGTHEISGTTIDGDTVKGNITVFPKEEKVKIATIGDSITYGMNVENVNLNSYPRQLNQRLGTNYQVENFGNSGKTLLENGNDPYIRTPQYKNSLALNPDVVVIQLGTNDTKAVNFSKINRYVPDYVKLLQTYKNLEAKPVVYVSLPPTIFSTAYDISQPNLDKIIPMIFEAAKEADVDASIIDNQTETRDAKDLIPDGVHPNAKGASILANNTYASLKGVPPIKKETIVINDYFKTHGGVTTTKNGLVELHNLANNNWVSFKNIELTGQELQLFAAVPYDNTQVIVHDGDKSGAVIGEKSLTRTGNVNTYSFHTVPLNETTGTRDITLEFIRKGSANNVELVRIAKTDFHYDSLKPLEVASFQELETALKSNLTNLKLTNDIVFARNIQLQEDTGIDLNGHTLDAKNYYIGKNEAVRQRITLTTKNGTLAGTHGYATVFAYDSATSDYGINTSFENVSFNGNVSQRSFTPNTLITERGENNLTHSLSGYNQLVYLEKDLSEFKGNFQLKAAVPYDNTVLTIRKGSETGEVVAEKLLVRTGNLNTYSYHTIELAELAAQEDLYFSVSRKGSNNYTELIRLAATNVSYDVTQPLEVASFQELETALKSNLTNLKLTNDIVFARNIQLQEDTSIDLNGHTLDAKNYYIGKNEAVRQRITLTTKNGALAGTHGYATIFAYDSTNDTYGINTSFENISFNGNVSQRSFTPNTMITERGENNLTHSLSGYNQLVYLEKDLREFKGNFQLKAAVPYDNTVLTIRKGSKTGEVVAEKLLVRTGNLNTYSYHTIELAELATQEDLYFSVSRKGSNNYTELVRLASTNVSYDATQPLEVASFQELETALKSNLTNLKLTNDIVFARNIQLQEDTSIDLNGHTLDAKNYYIGKNEAVRQRITLTTKNGTLAGTHGYATVFAYDSTNNTYGINTSFENVSFNGNVSQRSFTPNTVITERGENNLTHSLSGYNQLVYLEKDLSQSDGSIQLEAAVPYDNTYLTIRKGSETGEIIAEKLLDRTGNLNTFTYHIIELDNFSELEDLYFSVSRKGTSSYTELVRLKNSIF